MFNIYIIFTIKKTQEMNVLYTNDKIILLRYKKDLYQKFQNFIAQKIKKKFKKLEGQYNIKFIDFDSIKNLSYIPFKNEKELYLYNQILKKLERINKNTKNLFKNNILNQYITIKEYLYTDIQNFFDFIQWPYDLYQKEIDQIIQSIIKM